MTITAASVIRRVADTLQDVTGVRWQTDELVRWLNTSQRDVLVYRPDALSANVAFSCAAGTKQTLPSTAAKLLSVVRNTSGNKRGVRLIEREILDSQNPNWHSQSNGTEVVHYMYDVRDVRTFYVYPPVAAAHGLDIVVAAYPTDIAEPGAGLTYSSVVGNISLSDVYESALVDLILYRAYSKDAVFAGNAGRAAAALASAANTLGVEIKSFLMAAPNVTGAVMNPNAAKAA